MIRLPDFSGAASAAERDLPSFDVNAAIQTARSLRSQYIADRLGAAFTAFARWSGLSALFGALRRRLQHRRTLTALTQLDDRLLRDIGVSRAEIEVTAAFCCQGQPEETPSVWQRLGAWIARERRRRATVRELSAMSDELLADVGIERAEIPAVADALVDGQPIAPVAGEPVTATAPDLPVTAQVLAFVAVRSAVQREANQTHADRPAA